MKRRNIEAGKWRNKVNQVKQVIADSTNEKQIRMIRDELASLLNQVQDAYEILCCLQPYTDVSIEEIEMRQ